ncbi:MAG: M14 family zinc carboxypeptidase [Fibrobacteria bacterium]
MREIIGRSVEGRDLVLHSNYPAGRFPGHGGTGSGTLLIGGTHGDERATVAILENFAADRFASAIRSVNNAPLAILSLHNPDGHAADIRYNGRGVDLNRNFPHQWNPVSEEPPGPAPLSEPESRALHDFILVHRPAKIISLHWALSEIDADGPQSTGTAVAMWEALTAEERKPYRLRLQGQATSGTGECHGSLGQWCGNGLVYPDGMRPAMITLELPYYAHGLDRPQALPGEHLDQVRQIWRTNPDAYLEGVEGAVHKMLDAACRHTHVWPHPHPSASPAASPAAENRKG